MSGGEKWFVRFWAIGLALFSSNLLDAMLVEEVLGDPTMPDDFKQEVMQSGPAWELYLIMLLLQLGLYLSTTSLIQKMPYAIVIGMIPFSMVLLFLLVFVFFSSINVNPFGFLLIMVPLVLSVYMYVRAFKRAFRYWFD